MTSNAGRAGRAEHQRHAIEKKCRGERAEQEIFNGGFSADRGAAAESSQNIGGDRRNFQGDEDEYQFDGGRHEAHADRAEQNQAVIFAAADFLHVQVFI